jgi:hypothetical protein
VVKGGTDLLCTDWYRWMKSLVILGWPYLHYHPILLTITQWQHGLWKLLW